MHENRKPSTITTLVVDDVERWRNMLGDALNELGCKVLRLDDAQTAIDLLTHNSTINVLLLDWDLRGTSSNQQNTTGEDILRVVAPVRDDLTVIIITGAFHSANYLDWLKSEGIDIADEIFRISNWRPFKILSKIDLRSKETIIRELDKLLEEIDQRRDFTKKPLKAFKASPPFQLEGSQLRLIDSKKRVIPLDQESYKILEGLLYKPPGTYEARSTQLTYSMIAQIICKVRGVNPAENEDKARQLAFSFRNKLRRLLKQYGIEDRNALIRNLKDRGYQIGSAWHEDNPMVYDSEPSLIRRDIEAAELQSNEDFE